MTAQRTRTATTLWVHLPALVKLDFQEMAKSAKVRNRYFVFFLFYYYYFFKHFQLLEVVLSLYTSYKDPLRFWIVLKNGLDVTKFHNGVLVTNKMILYVKAFLKQL